MIYGKNTTSLGNYDSESVAALEGYEGVVGSLQIMTESYINEGKMFKFLIERDFQEAVDIRNGVFTESAEVLTEGASEIFAKIKEMIKKAWAKVKGLFKSFIAKFEIMMRNDTKSLYKKYSKQWVSGRTKKLKKYKYCTLKDELSGDGAISATNILKQYAAVHNSVISTRITKENLESISDDISDGTKLDEFLSAFAGISTDSKSFAKDYHDKFFDEEETYTDEVLDSKIVSDVDKYLNQNKLLSGIQKAAKENDRLFSELLKSIDSAQKEIVNYITSKDKNSKTIDLRYKNKETRDIAGKHSTEVTQDNADLSNMKISTLRSLVSTAQRAANMVNSAYLTAAKFEIAQCKRIFSQVVHKGINEAAYLDAIGEGAEFEVYTDLQ